MLTLVLTLALSMPSPAAVAGDKPGDKPAVAAAEARDDGADPGAADDSLIAGRPGFVEARGVVQTGAVQLEAGWSYALDMTGDNLAVGTSALTTGVLRLGALPRVELRLANLGYATLVSTGSGDIHATRGVPDLQVGAKLLVLTEAQSGIELGVIPMMSVPTGTRSLSTGTYDPSVAVSVGRALPEGFDATGVVRAAWATVDAARVTAYAAGVMLTHDLGTPWSGFTEVFVTSGPTAWNINTGLARRVSRRCQLDVTIGHSLNGAAPTWSLGAGLVVRR